MRNTEILKKNILIYSWIISTLNNMTAIVISYSGDFFTGYTIVFLSALPAIIMAFAAGTAGEDEAI